MKLRPFSAAQDLRPSPDPAPKCAQRDRGTVVLPHLQNLCSAPKSSCTFSAHFYSTVARLSEHRIGICSVTTTTIKTRPIGAAPPRNARFNLRKRICQIAASGWRPATPIRMATNAFSPGKAALTRHATLAWRRRFAFASTITRPGSSYQAAREPKRPRSTSGRRRLRSRRVGQSGYRRYRNLAGIPARDFVKIPAGA